MRFERYDRIVEHYPAMWPLLTPGYVPILNAMQDVVRALTDRPRRILDLGCGPGSATIAVAPACDPEGHVTLVDGSAAMLHTAQELLGQHVGAVVCGDFTSEAVVQQVFGPARYDLVLVSFALHHLTDAAKHVTIEHVANSLAEGGLMLLADEVEVDRPAGWDVIERIRSRIVDEHLQSGRISREFWEIETSHPAEISLPFRPARVEDLTSWSARAGLAVSCPVTILGTALLLGVKPHSRASAAPDDNPDAQLNPAFR